MFYIGRPTVVMIGEVKPPVKILFWGNKFHDELSKNWENHAETAKHLFNPIISSPLMSHPILSHPILSYPILLYPIIFNLLSSICRLHCKAYSVYTVNIKS